MARHIHSPDGGRPRRLVVATMVGFLLAATVGLFARPADAAYPGVNGRLYFSTRHGTNDLDIWWVDTLTGQKGKVPAPAVNSAADDWAQYWSPDGTQMLFQSRRDGDVELFVWDQPSGQVTQLTNNTIEDSYGSWSPVRLGGSRWVVFQRRVKNNLDLYVMNPDVTNSDGSHPASKLWSTSKDDHHPAWSPSPDKNQIAFVNASDGDDEIYVLDVAFNEGNTVNPLPDADDRVEAVGSPMNVSNNRVSDYSPDWSPDATQMVFVREPTRINKYSANANIWRMNSDGSGQMLVRDHQLIDRQPDWSPDPLDPKIAFASGSDTSDATWDIWVMDVNGNNVTNVTTDDEFGDFVPDWRNTAT